jgi:hypothetical protein
MKETTSGYTVLPKGLEKKEEKKNFQLWRSPTIDTSCSWHSIRSPEADYSSDTSSEGQ